MKKTLLSLIACVSGVMLMAQANNYPNGSTVSDFTVTDTDGEVHNLYSITSSGKWVILDFFFDTCPPCQQTQAYYNELHETYGCNSADLFVISINNGTDNDAAVIAFENTYGGSFQHSPAVSVDGGSDDVDNAFGVNQYPTYCLVGPDNIMVANDIWPINNMSTYVAAFPSGSNINPAACAVGINEQSVASFTDAFPVPTSGTITLSIEAATSAQLTVEVYDILGQQVMIQSLGMINSGSNNSTIDLSALSDGQYILKLMAGVEVADVKRISLAR